MNLVNMPLVYCLETETLNRQKDSAFRQKMPKKPISTKKKNHFWSSFKKQLKVSEPFFYFLAIAALKSGQKKKDQKIF